MGRGQCGSRAIALGAHHKPLAVSILQMPHQKATSEMLAGTAISTPPLLPTILIIEDDHIICVLLDDLLSEFGYPVTCVHDGQRGFEAIWIEPPVLVLLAVGLPLIDGEGVLRRIADDDPTPAVILMLADPPGRRIADQYAVAGYLPKPFDLDTVIDLVATDVG